VWRWVPESWKAGLYARADRTLRSAAARRGFDLVPRSPYTPVPTVPPADSPEWGPKHTLAGLAFDTEAQLDWLRRDLAPHLGELTAPRAGLAYGDAFPLDNGYYSGLDAVVLHAALRRLKPRRVIEVGGGYSTMVLAGVAARNAAEGAPCEVVSIDPEPRRPLPPPLAAAVRVDRRSAAAVPLAELCSLAGGDVLFVDSSHTVKRGSEVNYLVLEVLPRLAAGVVVHFHDVFLPFDYPREWFVRGSFLAEQYLVHAFLLGNPAYEVLFAAHAVAHAHPDSLRALVPGVTISPPGPAALWLRRRG
jgi:hypothetical protein